MFGLTSRCRTGSQPNAIVAVPAVTIRSFSLQELRYRYPLERLPEGLNSSQYLRRRTFEPLSRWRASSGTIGSPATAPKVTPSSLFSLPPLLFFPESP